MEMNYLAIILAIAWILLIIRGIHHGILRMIFGVLSVILVLAIASRANPIVVSYLEKNNKVVEWSDKTAEKYVETKNNAENDDSGSGSTDSAEGIKLPSFMRDSMLEQLEKIRDDVKNTGNDATQKIKEATVEIVSSLIIKGIATIIVLIGSMIIIAILKVIINLIGKLPIINGASKLFGGVLGALEGLVLIWLVIFLIECFSATPTGDNLMSQVESSNFLVTVSEANPFHRLL
jgi:uncharacterized membrane protein required for colicin V production